MNKLDKIKSFPNVTDKSRKFQILEKIIEIFKITFDF